ncbi:hypothetical protein BT93_C0852 [Corymbia citriodora subsp. variegata]|nr:hypothetical protein BT93_C0852 [Corymbia citriodora subsp. variegata]
MASGQLTAPTFSARLVSSFEGLKPSTLKFASVRPFKAGSLTQRSFRGLVVRAATVVAPKAPYNVLYCLFSCVGLEVVAMLQLRHCFGKLSKVLANLPMRSSKGLNCTGHKRFMD